MNFPRMSLVIKYVIITTLSLPTLMKCVKLTGKSSLCHQCSLMKYQTLSRSLYVDEYKEKTHIVSKTGGCFSNRRESTITVLMVFLTIEEALKRINMKAESDKTQSMFGLFWRIKLL